MPDFLKSVFTSKHERVQELLSAYLDNEISDQERELVERHLHTCEECQETLAELRWTTNLIQQVSPVPIPRSFTLPTTVEPILARRPAHPGRVIHYSLRWATAAAALLLVVVAGRDLLPGNNSATAPAQTAPKHELQAPQAPLIAQNQQESAPAQATHPAPTRTAAGQVAEKASAPAIPPQPAAPTPAQSQIATARRLPEVSPPTATPIPPTMSPLPSFPGVGNTPPPTNGPPAIAAFQTTITPSQDISGASVTGPALSPSAVPITASIAAKVPAPATAIPTTTIPVPTATRPAPPPIRTPSPIPPAPTSSPKPPVAAQDKALPTVAQSSAVQQNPVPQATAPGVASLSQIETPSPAQPEIETKEPPATAPGLNRNLLLQVGLLLATVGLGLAAWATRRLE
ncbi:MAG: hypothetical protein EXR62_09310 [Chloroflexi bacterium]|nr:hypothetical protein [Chloroflexota bacterium]